MEDLKKKSPSSLASESVEKSKTIQSAGTQRKEKLA